MEKDKLDLIKKIITLVDTKEGLKKVENAVDEVLRTQWDKEAKDREEYEKCINIYNAIKSGVYES